MDIDPIYAGAAVGLVLGSFGFIIVKFFVLPILGYKKIKRNLVSSITDYLHTINDERSDMRIQKKIDACVDEMKQHAEGLTECHDFKIPVWYRLLLKSRSESPEIAIEHLNVLYSTRDYKRAKNRQEKILQSLYM